MRQLRVPEMGEGAWSSNLEEEDVSATLGGVIADAVTSDSDPSTVVVFGKQDPSTC